ncbi:MAG TPA: ACT domain-containing protein [Desulfonatronum sp.]|nr:ACT domain-containing protein [Desulfonatronum sp.]
MKILANDGLADEALYYLKQEGFAVDTLKRDPDQLVKDIPGFDALIVRSATKVTREVIEAGAGNGAKLKIVGRGGVGTDNIDKEAAKEFGVIVKFAPQGNTNAAAEHALGLMFAIARRVPFAHCSLKAGVWYKKAFIGCELMGKTLGIIGCGRIGQALAAKAKGLGMRVIGVDVFHAIDSQAEYVDTKQELLEHSDFVSLHTGGTDVIIGEAELALMKSTAFLINASRGMNVSEEALYKALKENRIAGAAMDCFEVEPKREGEPFLSRLRELDNIVFSAHLGASTRNAVLRTSLEIAEVVANYLRRGDFQSSVNVGETVEEEGRRIYTLFITHEDKPGMFGKIATTLGNLGVNIRENNSRQLKDLVQTVYTIHQAPTDEVVTALKAIQGIRRVVY